MRYKSRKRRSEAQRRHAKLLHKSRRDPAAYREATLEAMSKTAEEYRERARVADANTERYEKEISKAENQIAQLTRKLISVELETIELLQAIDDKEKKIREAEALCSELEDGVCLLHREIHQFTVGI